MGSKKRSNPPEAVEMEVEDDKAETPGDSNALKTADEPQKKNMKPMERRKKRKTLDKERRHNDSDNKADEGQKPAASEAASASCSSMNGLPGFHIDVFKDLASADLSVRKAAVEKLASELIEVQKAYERIGGDTREGEEGAVQLEAEKDDGLENCAPSLRYAIRRLIRGVSSSREVFCC